MFAGTNLRLEKLCLRIEEDGIQEFIELCELMPKLGDKGNVKELRISTEFSKLELTPELETSIAKSLVSMLLYLEIRSVKLDINDSVSRVGTGLFGNWQLKLEYSRLSALFFKTINVWLPSAKSLIYLEIFIMNSSEIHLLINTLKVTESNLRHIKLYSATTLTMFQIDNVRSLKGLHSLESFSFKAAYHLQYSSSLN